MCWLLAGSTKTWTTTDNWSCQYHEEVSNTSGNCAPSQESNCRAMCWGTHRSVLRRQPFADVLRVHDGICNQIRYTAGAPDGQDDLPVRPAQLCCPLSARKEISEFVPLYRMWATLQGLHNRAPEPVGISKPLQGSALLQHRQHAPVQSNHVGQVGEGHVAVAEVQQVLVLDAGDGHAVLAHRVQGQGGGASTAGAGHPAHVVGPPCGGISAQARI